MSKPENTKSIYARLADARDEFHKLELTKTGHNKFAGYKYFELSDFLVPAMQCLKNEGLVPVISFEAEYASMTVHVADDPGDIIVITSPMAEAHLKGCHPIQNAGAVQTYQRRYLWTTLMEVLEHDALDGSEPIDEEPPKPKAKPKAKPKPKPKPEPEEEPEDDGVVLDTEDGAAFVADQLIQLTDMHTSLESIKDFWRKNIRPINKLKEEYPAEYDRVLGHFTRRANEFKEEG